MYHIFVLRTLTEITKTQKKKYFFTFIDFSKAFDSECRFWLWQKQLASKIKGKVSDYIQ